MKLYKYMSSKRATDFFSRPLLRLTNPNDLNDPFEFALTKRLSSEIESMLRKDETMRNGFDEYIHQFRSYGILSLSETYDGLLMWSHYADEHRGAVLEFEIDEVNPYTLFSHAGMGEDNLSSFKKVDYRKTRPFQGLISPETFSAIRKYSIFTKSDEWMYEKEHRYAMHYSYADLIRVDSIQLNRAFKEAELDFEKFMQQKDVVVKKDGTWIDVRKTEIPASMLQEMWILTKHMKSYFFKRINLDCVTKVILGCGQGDDIETAMQRSPDDQIKKRFFPNEGIKNVLKAYLSEERFELDFKDYNGHFFSQLS